MSEPKTRPTRKSVSWFLENIDNPVRQEDGRLLTKLMTKITKEQPVIWGDGIVGFGRYNYKYQSGRKGSWPLTGFSPRKHSMSIYVMPGFGKYEFQLEKLGKHKHSVSCLYIARLSQVNIDVLKFIIEDSVAVMRDRYPA